MGVESVRTGIIGKVTRHMEWQPGGEVAGAHQTQAGLPKSKMFLQLQSGPIIGGDRPGDKKNPADTIQDRQQNRHYDDVKDRS